MHAFSLQFRLRSISGKRNNGPSCSVSLISFQITFKSSFNFIKETRKNPLHFLYKRK